MMVTNAINSVPIQSAGIIA